MNYKLEEIPYKTLRNLPKTIPNNVGTKYRNEYAYDIKENLIVGLVKTGEIDQYEKIQLHADECKIENILAKAAVDPTILQQRKGMFIDTTEMPKSLAEFKNLELKVIREYDKLDLETKKKFDNSVDKFVSEYGTEKWAEAMGINNVEEVKEIVEETITKPEEKEEVLDE